MVPSVSSTPASQLLDAKAAMPTKVEDAARQFESLMISEMLRTSRESGSTGLGGGDGTDGEADTETSTMLDLADQQFAKMLTQKGGIGLTHFIVNGLNKS